MCMALRSEHSAEQELALAVSLRALVLLVTLALSLIGLSIWSAGIIRHAPAPASPWIDATAIAPWIPAGGEPGGEHWYVP